MNAFDLLDKLRSKPEPVKQLIAFWSAVLITLIIAGVWLASLTLGSNSASAKQGEDNSPFALIRKSWDDMTKK